MIVSSNPKVISIFSDMQKIIISEGGIMNPDICIIEENGNLIVESPLGQNNNDIIFSVPASCLPSTNDFTISLDKDNLVITACKEYVTPLHEKMYGLMIDLFNQTQKISYHKKTFPLALLNNSLVFDFVAKKCPGICAKHKKLSNELSHDQLLIKTFLGCRHLNINLTNKNNTQVLMPFIDSLNHHVNSSGIDIINNSADSLGYLQIRHSKPLLHSNECFINYGPTDPMPRYFHFGYIDTTPHHLHSTPVILDLPKLGKIIINPFNTNANESLINFPDKLKDIEYFLPKATKRNENILAWRLLIPSASNPSALRRILEVLIINLAGKKLKRKRLEKYIKNTEIEIINKNKAYFKEMLALANSNKLEDIPEAMIKDFSTLANLQLDLLKKYQQKANKLAFCFL